MPPDSRLTELARARAEAAKAEAALARSVRALSTVERTATDARLAAARRDVQATRARLDAIRDRIRELSDRLDADEGADALVAGLAPGYPVALLPVRLETRFTRDHSALRVRIFPDQIHLDQHEPALTEGEATAGKWYWTQRWEGDADVAAAGWEELSRMLGPRRAHWVAKSTMPTNIAAIGTSVRPKFPELTLRDGSWRMPTRARALPDRWLVVGKRKGKVAVRKWGRHVPDVLAVGLAVDPADVGAENPEAEESPETPPNPEAGPLLDPDARWMVDFQAAVEKGLALTIEAGDILDGGRVSDGFEQLIAIGVDWTRTPEEAAEDMADLLGSHVHSDGLAFVAAGTPTNSTEATPAGSPTEDAELAKALDPALPDPAPRPGSAARAIELALGLPADRAALARAPRADSSEEATAGLVLGAVWEATAGYYLDQLMDPLLDDATVAEAKSHALQHLRPGGPLPAFRAGPQPYGVLPIHAPSRFEAISGFEGGLHQLLLRLRSSWIAALGTVPRLGADRDPDAELARLLQQAPVAARARFRRAYGPETEANFSGLAVHASAQQLLAGIVAREIGGWNGTARIQSFTTDPRSFPLAVPWARPADHPDDQPLGYLAEIAALIREPDGRARLSERENAGTLFEALVAHSAVLELDRAVARVVAADQARRGALLAPRALLRSAELVNLATETTEPADAVAVSTPRQLANLVLPETTGQRTVAEHVAHRLAAGRAQADPQLAAFVAGLEALATRPAGEVEWAFRAVLDAFSTRLDAWQTSLATRRLKQLRTAKVEGTHLGGYGWVDDVRPDHGPDSLGYLHAPSLEQAKTAAILRSGHLAHRRNDAAGRDLLNIDLTSTRVQRGSPCSKAWPGDSRSPHCSATGSSGDCGTGTSGSLVSSIRSGTSRRWRRPRSRRRGPPSEAASGTSWTGSGFWSAGGTIRMRCCRGWA